jgi:hypothetical protein
MQRPAARDPSSGGCPRVVSDEIPGRRKGGAVDHSRHHVEKIAEAVAEHASVSWDDALKRSATDHERALIEELRTLFLVSTVSDEAQLPPKRLGDFEILREIGRGSFGVVYEALQVSLRRRVALKILSPEATHRSRFVHRFRREAVGDIWILNANEERF